MRVDDIDRLIEDDIRVAVRELSDSDSVDFSIKLHNAGASFINLIAEQVNCRRKAKKKIPSFVDNECLFESVALEQCSGEAVAFYKTGLIFGNKLLDLTCGLGVDSMFLSSGFNSVVCCEISDYLCKLARINAGYMNINNVSFFNTDAIEYLRKIPDKSVDWIYVDPARRDSNKRFVELSKCFPNVIAHKSELLRKSNNVCIKASPALDLTRATIDLPQAVSFEVISVLGECKEILIFLSDKSINKKDIKVSAVLLDLSGNVLFKLTDFIDSHYNKKNIQSAGKLFFEPDPAIIKSGLVTVLARNYGLWYINSTVDYLSGNFEITKFPGRMFYVIKVLVWNRKLVKKYLKALKIKKANISRRDFPIDPIAIKKMLSLNDGGDDYFFFTVDKDKRKICIHCKKTDKRID